MDTPRPAVVVEAVLATIKIFKTNNGSVRVKVGLPVHNKTHFTDILVLMVNRHTIQSTLAVPPVTVVMTETAVTGHIHVMVMTDIEIILVLQVMRVAISADALGPQTEIDSDTDTSLVPPQLRRLDPAIRAQTDTAHETRG